MDLKTLNLPKNDLLMCDKCGYISSKSNFESHLIIKNNEESILCICPNCEDEFIIKI